MTKVLIDGQESTTLAWELAGESGFFDGSRVMTTLQARGSWLVDFERHMKRLGDHATRLGMNNIPAQELIKFEIDSLIQTLKTPEISRVRVILFRDKTGGQHRIVTAAPEIPDSSEALKNGLKIKPVIDKAWPRGSLIKTGQTASKSGDLLTARAAGFDDVLWINGDGEIAETTWANVFLIGRTGDLVEIATPPDSSGILTGITRARITELLYNAKIPVTERVITEDEIPRFDEAFVTSSVRGLVPVAVIGGHRLHTMRSQAVFHHIARLYNTWLSLGGSSDNKGLRKESLS
jgi:branched-subunit amino acid aminotransferase/4-amino-4-deoxychorismate lyase